MLINIIFHISATHSIEMIVSLPLWLPTLAALAATMLPAVLSFELREHLRQPLDSQALDSFPLDS